MSMLTDLDTVKAWLATNGLAFPATDDDLLTGLIQSVSGFIEAWLNRTIASASYTFTGNGTGSRRLLLPNYPVSAVASLMVDGLAVLPSAGFGLPGFAFDDLGLWLTGSVFTRGVQNVSVAYTAGFATVPYELQQACIATVALRYRERERIGMASKAMSGETTAYTIKDFPVEVATILKNYRKVVPI